MSERAREGYREQAGGAREKEARARGARNRGAATAYEHVDALHSIGIQFIVLCNSIQYNTNIIQ